MVKRFAAVFVLVCIFYYPAHAQLNIGGLLDAGSDAVKAVTLSDADVKELSSKVAKESDSMNPVAPASSKHAKRLAEIVRGMKVDDGLKPTIKVYLVKDVNAFALADGNIRVFAGLMNTLTDDEVRYVIGHEIGHVALGHTKKAMQMAYAASAARKAGASSTNSVVSSLSGSALADITEKMIHAQFSQSQENDADQYALQFMKKNKYDPKAAVSALRKLEKMFGNDRSVFSSHPAPGDRAQAMESSL